MPAKYRLRFILLPVLPAVLFLGACTAPLGPGYTIEKQSLEVHFLAGDPPRVGIQARYRLKNTGNRSLSLLDLKLPGEKEYGRTNLRVTLDGVVVSLSPASNSETAQILFPQPWPRKEVHEVALGYDLTKELSPWTGIAMTSDSLFLSSAGWYPVLRSPHGLFGKVDDRQRSPELALRVPEGYLAHSSGRARGVRKENGEFVYRFRTGEGDSDPFVVAGRFFEQRFPFAGTTVVFWTPKDPLLPDQLARAGGHFAATLNEYEKNFGALGKKQEPYRVVGMMSWPSARVAGYPEVGTPNFPRGAVLPVILDSSDKAVSANLLLGDYALAQSWFGGAEGAGPSPSASFNEILCFYAAKSIGGEASGKQTDRKVRIQAAVRLYTEMQKQTKERSLLVMTEGHVPAEKLLVLMKGEMFFAALEDRCGAENLRHALRHLVQTLRGSTYGYDELRSALEQECHQDLGPMFREWLTKTGIPADFRERYETRP